ncbi:MAG: FtsX-like permease family protein, partial [Eubacteriales bacterium]
KGEKESKFLIPSALFGVGGIALSYILAQTLEGASTLLLFFPIAALVIVSTIFLFRSGSIVFLALLRKNKKLYYKPDNFISISGMFQRMNQNASGLAVICILGTMLVVTVCFSTSLYVNMDANIRSHNPYDAEINLQGVDDQTTTAFDAQLGDLAIKHNVGLVLDTSKLVHGTKDTNSIQDRFIIQPDSKLTSLRNSILLDGTLMFDIKGTDQDGEAFVADAKAIYNNLHVKGGYFLDIYSSRSNSYGLFGGLIFTGAFFAILFLTLTVLIIYFKQITEGHEDKERFVILQKVGMDDKQVKSTINRQILWVFFIPLAMALLNAAFSLRLLEKIQGFMIADTSLTLWIMLATCAVFTLVYLIAYRLTAKTYYKIVKWS